MATIYLSSTYSDLKAYREAVYDTLRKMRYDVIAMEDYVATDQRPLDKCLADVAACDLYIGLFAWRYGYIPLEWNPEQKSITELEYRQAIKMGKPCLLFLLAEDVPWSPLAMDVVSGEGERGERIKALRREFAQEKLVSFFKAPEELASLVGSAVHLWEKSRTTSDISKDISLTHKGQQEKDKWEIRLRALLADHSGFIRDRLESFVGRQVELGEIRQRINEKLRTGGYVTITGQAGQGKSSIIVKLVDKYGPEQVASHFIPFNPGPDHQVGLLRNLMARLILKYDLSDLYVASESRPALRDYFLKVLVELVQKGGQEVIFVDGLDQLEEDFNGVRDLSFLPNDLPTGVVFVLGTRPNDTLAPLELLKPHYEYKLPNLSRHDFDLVLQHRQVILDRELADRFYQAMQENALYLDLVAKELAQAGTMKPEEIIQRVADNPENIFSLAIARLKRPSGEWREVLKPILGVLLVTREPLSMQHIRQILGIEHDRLRDGLARLGGLVVADGLQRYSLFHLKLYSFLRQDEIKPHKEYIFAADEEENWNKRFVDWCEQEGLSTLWEKSHNPIEQGRREYACQHYIAHLYFAQQWQQLFAVLDAGVYGRAKVHTDPSTRLFAQDLDLGRLAAAWEEWSLPEGVEQLPNLWRYTLLRCSLTSQADSYPPTAFDLLLLLNREAEAVGLAELLTKPRYKIQVLLRIAKYWAEQPDRVRESVQMILRAVTLVRTIKPPYRKVPTLRMLGEALVEEWHWLQVETIWVEVEAATRSIEESSERAWALRELGLLLLEADQRERAESIWAEAEAVTYTIEKSDKKAFALSILGLLLFEADQRERAEVIWADAEAVARSIGQSDERSAALSFLATTLVKTQQWERAEVIWANAEAVARSIEENSERAWALRELVSALAQVQQWERAEAVARDISQSIERAVALRNIATSMVHAQQWERAEEIARSIEESFQRVYALRELAIALAQVQQWERAEVVARSIEESFEKAWALSALGIELLKAKAGQSERVEVIWAETVAVIRSIKERSERAVALRELAMALAQVQQWEQVEEIARSIEERSERAFALWVLGTALADAQQWERAEVVARSIEENYWKALTLSELGSALFEANQRERANIIWADAEAATQSIEESIQRAWASRNLAIALAHAQQWERAEAVAQSIENNSEKAWALRELGTELFKKDQGEQAEVIWADADVVARTIMGGRDRALALSRLGKALFEAGQRERAKVIWAQAEVAARDIEESFHRVRTLCELGADLFKADQREQAKIIWAQADTVARTIKGGHDRAFALSGLGTALAQAQQWKRAETVARSIEQSDFRAIALSALGTELAQMQEQKSAEAFLTEAEEIVHSVEEDHTKVQVLCTLASELIREDKHEQLLRLVQRCWQRAETRQYAIQLLSLVHGLISLKPELGIAFYEGFKWVDIFLSGW